MGAQPVPFISPPAAPLPEPTPTVLPASAAPPVIPAEQITQHVQDAFDGMHDLGKAAVGHAVGLATGNATPAPEPAMPTAGLPAMPPQSPASLPLSPGRQIPQPSASQMELSRLRSTGSGISQLPLAARIPLTIADAIGTGLFPRIAAEIPGTTAHHNVLVGNEEGAVKDEQTAQQESAREALQEEQSKEAQAGIPLKAAQTNEANARAESLLNPPAKEATPKESQILYDKAGNPIGYQDEHGKMFGPKDENLPPGVAAVLESARSKTPPAPHFEKGDDGTIYSFSVDPETGKVTKETLVPGSGKGKATQLSAADRGFMKAAGGDPDDENTWSSTVMKNFRDLKTEKAPGAEEGSFSLQEDASGKPILLNSKTGAIKPAEGVQKAGTKAKVDEAHEKQIGPARDALQYAEDYIANGVHTGPGDEALQEKFFELAKPTTGFRMTQPQIDMLQNSRSWMDSAAAKFRHMTTGTWFSDDQRRQIVGTMRQLADAKMKGTQGEAGTPAADPKVKAYADQYFGGDSKKAQDAIDEQRKAKK